MDEQQQQPNGEREGEPQLPSAPTPRSLSDLLKKANEVRDFILAGIAIVVAFLTGADQIANDTSLINEKISIPILIACGVILIGVGLYYIFYTKHRLLGGLVIYSTLVTGIAFWLMTQFFISPVSIEGTAEAIVNDVVDGSFPLVSCITIYKLEDGEYTWVNGVALAENNYEFAGLGSGIYELRIENFRSRVTVPSGINRLLSLFVVRADPIPVVIIQNTQQNTSETSQNFFSDEPQQNLNDQQSIRSLNCRQK